MSSGSRLQPVQDSIVQMTGATNFLLVLGLKHKLLTCQSGFRFKKYIYLPASMFYYLLYCHPYKYQISHSTVNTQENLWQWAQQPNETQTIKLLLQNSVFNLPLIQLNIFLFSYYKMRTEVLTYPHLSHIRTEFPPMKKPWNSSVSQGRKCMTRGWGRKHCINLCIIYSHTQPPVIQ